MNVSPIAAQVANGRRLAARSIVMNSIAKIPCQVWRKRVIQNDPATPTGTGISWNTVALSDADEPEIEYDELGYANLLLDRFTGANVYESNSGIDGGDAVVMAQIEPFDNTLDKPIDQLRQIPAWTPQKGDLFALLITADLVIWMELMEISGQSLVSDFGKKYLLNKRDELTHMEPFKTEFESRPPAP